MRVLHRLNNFGKVIAEFVAGYLAIVIFFVLYIIAFAPLALIMRMRGRHFLPQFARDANSFYLMKEKIEPTPERMKRQW